MQAGKPKAACRHTRDAACKLMEDILTKSLCSPGTALYGKSYTASHPCTHDVLTPPYTLKPPGPPRSWSDNQMIATYTCTHLPLLPPRSRVKNAPYPVLEGVYPVLVLTPPDVPKRVAHALIRHVLSKHTPATPCCHLRNRAPLHQPLCRKPPHTGRSSYRAFRPRCL